MSAALLEFKVRDLCGSVFQRFLRVVSNEHPCDSTHTLNPKPTDRSFQP